MVAAIGIGCSCGGCAACLEEQMAMNYTRHRAKNHTCTCRICGQEFAAADPRCRICDTDECHRARQRELQTAAREKERES